MNVKSIDTKISWFSLEHETIFFLDNMLHEVFNRDALPKNAHHQLMFLRD
jgi:hypothetical protein